MGANLILLVVMIGIFYFMIIRPQKKRQTAYQEMLKSLKVGDRIVTIGGIHGKVVKIDGNNIAILTGKANKTRLVMIKNSIDHIEK